MTIVVPCVPPKTAISRKRQVVIPKEVKEKLSLRMETVLKIELKGLDLAPQADTSRLV